MKTVRIVARRSCALLLLLLGAALVSERAALAQVVGDWDPTGSLNVPRDGHTATLLPNGKVLVVGGYNGSEFTRSAEIYDSTTETWTVTGSLSAPRSSHTATLLANGKVLVTGGYSYVDNQITVLNSAELYDPATGLWSITGNLNIARREHKAVMLSNGAVLVIAGWNGGFPSSAELYDPSTGTWSITGNLNTARHEPTVTLLPNGKVLVAGGFTGSFPGGSCPCRDPVTSTAELYDPATGAWSFTGSLNTDRSLHAATLLQSGKVLVAGGTDGLWIDIGEYAPLTSAELYDPVTGTWSVTASLNIARNLHTATLLSNGKVLAAAGYYTDSAELYDQETGTWSFTGSLDTTRVGHTATLLPNGKVLVVSGGYYFSSASASAELYDPTAVGTVTLPLVIGASVLPDAEVGVAYSVPLVNGGRPPYTVNLLRGVLPPGLSDTLASGALSGTPASTRTRSFSVQITDDRGSSVTGTFTLKILRALENHTSALKIGTNGRPYKATLKAAGGKKPYSWSLISGNLPAGLSLNSLTGVISGIPTETGTFDLTFQVTDPVGGIAQKALALTIKSEN